MSGRKKDRLDLLLVERGLAETRNKAQALIMSGTVLVNDVPAEKPGMAVDSNSEIRLKEQPKNYVSRGGDKLEGALAHFEIDPSGQVVVDLGASTGGFSDCLLRRGVIKIYAVDVGTNQLHYSLRQDERIVSLENTHARDLARCNFSPKPSLGVVDVSFISLRKVLPFLVPEMAHEFEIIALVKPQFELGKEHIESGGVVRDLKKQKLAVDLVEQYCRECGLSFRGSVASVKTGAKKGNQEYFVLISNSDE